VILVVDALVLVAALVDSGPDGEWAAEVLGEHELAAPHLMPIEAANILRRAALAGDITADTASLAHGDLLDLRIELWPYAPVAERCWQLRDNVTTYDGTYVALAERLDAPLATLDRRLASASGPRCRFTTPRQAPARPSGGRSQTPETPSPHDAWSEAVSGIGRVRVRSAENA
jgi:predicted nucleic acid-binding protein